VFGQKFEALAEEFLVTKPLPRTNFAPKIENEYVILTYVGLTLAAH